MKAVRVGALPDGPLAAAALFYGSVLPGLTVGEDTVLVFHPADHTHRGWRLAAVQQLARDFAPIRVNALASDDEAAITAALTYLETASGVTGQYLPLDGNGVQA